LPGEQGAQVYLLCLKDFHLGGQKRLVEANGIAPLGYENQYAEDADND
jgi:hypothetical protein